LNTSGPRAASVRIEFPLREIRTEFGILLDPSIELSLKSPGGYLRVRFLLDSGADFTILPRSAALQLGINLTGSREMIITGIEGAGVRAWLSEITVRMADSEMTLPCLFSSNEKTPYVLGRMGLFQRFNVAFDNRRKKIVLESISMEAQDES